MKKILFAILLSIASQSGYTQRVMTLDECMAYAAEHSSEVRLARWDLTEAKVNTSEALAGFLPSLSAQVGAQYNWGRNIDPETNTYNNVTTFNNGYGLYASLTIFDGGRTFNRYKQARVLRSRQTNTVDMRSDDCAISAMLAYVDAAHYRQAIEIASDKLRQSQGVLDLTLAQEQLGIKSLPDVAQARRPRRRRIQSGETAQPLRPGHAHPARSHDDAPRRRHDGGHIICGHNPAPGAL